MARGGIVFSDGHSPASVCTPSRYSILTGKYPFRSKLDKSVLFSAYDSPLLKNETETLQQMLKRGGYKTAAFGKWHLGMDWVGKNKRDIAKPGINTSKFTTTDIDFNYPITFGVIETGFDYFFGIASSINHGPYSFIENNRITSIPIRIRKEYKKDGMGGPFREGWIASNWDDANQGTACADKAISFIKNNSENPFFIYFAAPANHFPYNPRKEYRGKPIKGIGGNKDGLSLRCDMIYENDMILGEIISSLKDPNGDKNDNDSVFENTLIVFTSDNGADKGYIKSLRGKKGSIYEGGHRVPFIASWPNKIKKGIKSESLISSIDLYRTFASITGIKVKKDAAKDSESLPDVLLGNNLNVRRNSPLIHQDKGTAKYFAIRDDSYKLIIKNDKATELYNLNDDLLEDNNLIKIKPEVSKRLFGLFNSARK